MAGSYDHITTLDGDWKGIRNLENLGDANEALRHCWLMIQVLSCGDLDSIASAKEAAIRIERVWSFE